MDWLPTGSLAFALARHAGFMLLCVWMAIRFARRRELWTALFCAAVALELFTSVPIRLVHTTYELDGTVQPKATPSPP